MSLEEGVRPSSSAKTKGPPTGTKRQKKTMIIPVVEGLKLYLKRAAKDHRYAKSMLQHKIKITKPRACIDQLKHSWGEAAKVQLALT